ncbi:hypothetical protein BKA67DRAFT_539161 [Truncatella angustata]|uniref:Uncharacterized protein n=1 Tax=Truncatella angustata TaxID=152316 RepID=A0A9P8UFT5_9PEZI|nr:uncharacterized protein BKA67DRAFT_539161 [Truncatella angustata]KAH6649172.1 hypothetical protein BKA67DRAFT_539161 [Truncatella angustata]
MLHRPGIGTVCPPALIIIHYSRLGQGKPIAGWENKGWHGGLATTEAGKTPIIDETIKSLTNGRGLRLKTGGRSVDRWVPTNLLKFMRYCCGTWGACTWAETQIGMVGGIATKSNSLKQAGSPDKSEPRLGDEGDRVAEPPSTGEHYIPYR